ncbi:MAG: IS110 family transposase, partial [[Mycobacterium] stephanolepidis]
MTTVFCGIDWGESRHDVAIIDQAGVIVARAKIRTDVAGFTQLLQLLAAAGDTDTEPIPIAIETDHGLLVSALRAAGRLVYALNPLAASRYRARHQVSGAKSDATDAVLLANIVRTDIAAHRPLPADTELAQAIRVLARAQQDAVWARQKLGNQIRCLLNEFYPAAIEAFGALAGGGLARAEARAILTAASTPAKAARLTRAKLKALLIKSGRQRGITDDVDRLFTVFRGEYLRQPAAVEEAMGVQLATLLLQFEAACQASDELETAARAHFEQHPDAQVITSFPGMGTLIG